MRVFISWSGERSKYVAEAIRAWLPKVLQSLRPWMSQEDITAGSRWLTDVSSELSQAKVGIICVTPENQHNPWLQFESGALSKTIEQSYVCPILLDMQPGQLTGPLTQFQSVVLNQEGVMRLLYTLNTAFGDQQMPQGQLEEIFEVWWPRLEQKISSVPVATEIIKPRPFEEMLEEILQNTREQIRRENLRLEYSKERDSKFDSMFEMFESSFGTLRQAKDASSMFKKIAELNNIDGTESESVFKRVSQTKDVAGVGKMLDFDVDALAKTIKDMKSLTNEQKKMTESILNGPDKENKEVD